MYEQRDFFISYTEVDDTWARKVAAVLEKNGYSYYVRYRDSAAGGSFVDWMDRAIAHSRHFIAIWSKAYSESYFCGLERDAAVICRGDGTMGMFLPIRVEDYRLNTLFRAFSRVDVFGVNDEEAEKRLLSGLRSGKSVPALSAEDFFEQGKRFQYGREGSEQSYKRAVQCYEKAAKMGHGEALCYLGFLYLTGLGVQQDYKKAKQFYENSVNLGHRGALTGLGVLYHFGLGVPQDFVKARKYYEQRVLDGDELALYYLGAIYENGLGVKENYKKALEYFGKAAAKDHHEAKINYENLRKKMMQKNAQEDETKRCSNSYRKEKP